MNLLLDSGFSWACSCGPFRLFTDTYQPTVGQSISKRDPLVFLSSCRLLLVFSSLFVYPDALIALILPSSFSVACLARWHTPFTVNAVWARKITQNKNNKALIHAALRSLQQPPSCPPRRSFSAAPPSFPGGVPLSTELQAADTENELWNECECSWHRREVMKNNFPFCPLVLCTDVGTFKS